MDVLQHGIPDKTRPWFEPKDGIWAPDIKIMDGKYVLYYVMSV